MITDRNLPAGTLLKATYKAEEYLAEILTYENEAKLTVKVLEGNTTLAMPADRTFNSLSKAAMAITGNSVNGWRFWTLAAQPSGKTSDLDAVLDTPAGREALAGGLDPSDVGRVEGSIDLTVPPAAQEPASGPLDPIDRVSAPEARARKARSFTPIKQTANQRGTTAEETRMWCHGCQASFIARLGEADSGSTSDYKADNATCPNGHRVGDMREAALGANGEQD